MSTTPPTQNSLRNLKLGHRVMIYMVGMSLMGGVFLGVVYLGGWIPVGPKASLFRLLFLPWLVCLVAGLLSIVVVEPFRRPTGSPYGFLLGGLMRTAPPLVLVLFIVLSNQPTERLFWIELLLSYFFMLALVLLLILPKRT